MEPPFTSPLHRSYAARVGGREGGEAACALAGIGFYALRASPIRPRLKEIERTFLAVMSREELEERACRSHELALLLVNRKGEDSSTSSRPRSSNDLYWRGARAGRPPPKAVDDLSVELKECGRRSDAAEQKQVLDCALLRRAIPHLTDGEKTALDNERLHWPPRCSQRQFTLDRWWVKRGTCQRQ